MGLAAAAAAVLAAVACGDDTPNGPVAPTEYRWTLQVRVLTELQQPVAGALVKILDGPAAGQSATTDTTGTATFASLLQSGFTIEVSATGYVTTQAGVTLTLRSPCR